MKVRWGGGVGVAGICPGARYFGLSVVRECGLVCCVIVGGVWLFDEDSRRCVVVWWVEVLVTVVSHWAPSGPEKTLEISFSVKIQGGEFNVLPGPTFSSFTFFSCYYSWKAS